MTPRELRDEIASVGLRRRDNSTRDLVSAWHVATFGIAAYVGKLPSLSKVLARLEGPKGQMSPDGLAAAMKTVGIPGHPVSDAAMQAFLRTKES